MQINNTLEDALLPTDASGNPIQLYDWEDHKTSRNQIFDAIKTTMEKLFQNKEHNGVRMSISDIDYADPDYASISEQKKILHDDGYFARRLRGTVTLTDTKTGEILDQKTMTLLKAPVWTNRGTFIREGNEWGTINQTRLLPGAYSRYQNNGDLETLFNVRPGTGGSFRVNLDPEKAIWKFKTNGQEFHMYSLLHELGVSDEDMKRSWGEEIFNKNKESYDSRTFEKAYQKIVPEWDRKKNPGRSREEKVILIKNALNRALVATDVIKRTLPNMIDREKAAAWSQAAQIMEKVASLNTDDTKDVAEYINNAADKNIDTTQSKEEIEQLIKNVIVSGVASGNGTDNTDSAAAVVRLIKLMRLINGLKKKLSL